MSCTHPKGVTADKEKIRIKFISATEAAEYKQEPPPEPPLYALSIQPAE